MLFLYIKSFQSFCRSTKKQKFGDWWNGHINWGLGFVLISREFFRGGGGGGDLNYLPGVEKGTGIKEEKRNPF